MQKQISLKSLSFYLIYISTHLFIYLQSQVLSPEPYAQKLCALPLGHISSPKSLV